MRRDVRALRRSPPAACKRKAMTFSRKLIAAFVCITLGALPPVTYQVPAQLSNVRWFCILCGCAVAMMFWRLYRVRAEWDFLEARARAAGVLEERARIARELHDTLIQGIHALILNLQASAARLPNPDTSRREIDLALDRIETLLDEARGHIVGLRASMLPLDVARAIGNSAKLLLLERCLDFRMTVTGNPRPLQQKSTEQIYCIAREALRNAFAHAEAKTIEVDIGYREKDVFICVRDDGRGFGSASEIGGDVPGHFGLEGMRERAAQIDAELNIWSVSGTGTEVWLRVPASSVYLPAPPNERLPPSARGAVGTAFSTIRSFLSPARDIAGIARRYARDREVRT
jgi:signal transduction histidine kinase